MINLIQSMYHRYFVYSAEEESLRTQLYGANVSFGTVMVRGVPKKYTSIITDMANSKADAIVVTQGDIRKIRYTPPQRG